MQQKGKEKNERITSQRALFQSKDRRPISQIETDLSSSSSSSFIYLYIPIEREREKKKKETETEPHSCNGCTGNHVCAERRNQLAQVAHLTNSRQQAYFFPPLSLSLSLSLSFFYMLLSASLAPFPRSSQALRRCPRPHSSSFSLSSRPSSSPTISSSSSSSDGLLGQARCQKRERTNERTNERYLCTHSLNDV